MKRNNAGQVMSGQKQSVNNQNQDATADLYRDIVKAVETIDGQSVPISRELGREDIYTRALLDMAGVKGVTIAYPASKAYPGEIRMVASSQTKDAMFIDINGLSPEDTTKFVAGLKMLMGSTQPEIKSVAPENGSGYSTSFQVPISKMKELVPQMEKHLDVFYKAEYVEENKEKFFDLNVDQTRGKVPAALNVGNFNLIKPPGM